MIQCINKSILLVLFEPSPDSPERSVALMWNAAQFSLGASIYDVRNIFGFFLPPPPCHIHDLRNFPPFVCFLGTPHRLRTSYKYAPLREFPFMSRGFFHLESGVILRLSLSFCPLLLLSFCGVCFLVGLAQILCANGLGPTFLPLSTLLSWWGTSLLRMSPAWYVGG